MRKAPIHHRHIDSHFGDIVRIHSEYVFCKDNQICELAFLNGTNLIFQPKLMGRTHRVLA